MKPTLKKKYRNNFLKLVIYKLDFPHCPEIEEDTVKKYRESLGKSYGALSLIQQQGLLLQNEEDGLHTEVNNNIIWKIESADGSHYIEIDKSSITISFDKYVKFRDYMVLVEAAQTKFFEQFKGIGQLTRLGLRYINQIQIKEKTFNWQDYINPQLTSSLEFVDPSSLRRSMNNMVIAHDEETRINFLYGVFNKYFPAPVLENEFIIDLDAFTSDINTPDESIAKLKKFNQILAGYFELGITDKLRQIMGEINESEETDKQQ